MAKGFSASFQLSRVFVKNIPKYVSEDRLRDFFSRKGEVTDAKVIRTADGKSRQFAYVGFRTEEEAAEAIKYFDKSYMDTCRLECNVALKVGDPNIPRSWSRYSQQKQEALKEESKTTSVQSLGFGNSKGDAKRSKKSTENDDPKLQEFLRVMQSRTKSQLWANDASGNHLVEQNGKANKGDKKKRNQKQTELDESAEGDNESKERSDSDSDTDGSSSENLDDHEEDGKENDDLHASEFLEEKDEEGSAGEYEGDHIESENPSMGTKNEEAQILETGRLFVRNLLYSATEDDLAELFNKYGDVSQVHLVVDKNTKRSKGMAFILYAVPESAVRAFKELDNSIFQGRLLHVMPAQQQRVPEKASTSGQVSNTFKKQREEQRKSTEAGGDTRAWNSFFMRPDTVVENIARKYGLSKSDLLDSEADDLAVRIALGETHVIAETKRALVNSGVNIDALEEIASGNTDCVKRSNHVLLVKNLSYASSEGELAEMFGSFGSLDKIVLPPTKTLAVVVFLEAGNARAAFKRLAYKRYKDAPLYLEWAPANILSPNSKLETHSSEVMVGEQDVKRVLREQHVEGLAEADIDPDRVESRSLFVKNLNFKTSDESLRKHFTENMKEGSIRSVKVNKHVKNGKSLSMGFGFIEFDSVETALRIRKDLQGTVLDGHALILQPCHSKTDGDAVKKSAKDRSTTKLIVRNVAFQASQKDLRQLFSPFGQVKSLRLPNKLGSHRGFAFVEFVTKQEAQNALQALSNTHLYGRHLVLERAKEGETFEELRARTAAQFDVQQNASQNLAKLTKKRKHLEFRDEDRF
ncbi:hypothetical protein Scep_011148 [Stephania cephalantha]|uniref:RRM domain-containing protein n=1 Tax=Stephania cephalantha TaxID=152367 RepID=A0AAP0P803_9MAGN